HGGGRPRMAAAAAEREPGPDVVRVAERRAADPAPTILTGRAGRCAAELGRRVADPSAVATRAVAAGAVAAGLPSPPGLPSISANRPPMRSSGLMWHPVVTAVSSSPARQRTVMHPYLNTCRRGKRRCTEALF